jgi:hypothetical protein
MTDDAIADIALYLSIRSQYGKRDVIESLPGNNKLTIYQLENIVRDLSSAKQVIKELLAEREGLNTEWCTAQIGPDGLPSVQWPKMEDEAAARRRVASNPHLVPMSRLVGNWRVESTAFCGFKNGDKNCTEAPHPENPNGHKYE